MNTQLDSFETRLLAELRQHVAERAPVEDETVSSSRRSAVRWLAVAASFAALAIAAVLFVPGIGSSPAYSVGEGNAGEITVEINRPEDAAGLERALEDKGIAADITYLPELQTCAPGRYEAVERSASGLTASVGESQLSVTLPSDTVRSGETFVLAWSVLPLTDAEMEQASTPFGGVTDGFAAIIEIEIATGPVAPCSPIPATNE